MKFVWLVDEQDTASTDVLKHKGFECIDQVYAMKYDLGFLEYKEIDNVKQIDICDEKAKADFVSVLTAAFGGSDEENSKVVLHPISCIHDSSLIHMYLAYQQDMPIATGMMILHGEVAMINAIGVVPAERGKGFARMIVQKTLFDAQQKGCKQIILRTLNAEKPLYEKLGFTEYLVYSRYALPS